MANEDKALSRTLRAGLVLAAVLGAGCGTIPARFAMRDAAAARAVKKVAVMPFFMANTLSVDIEAPPAGFLGAKPYNYARVFAAEAQKSLGDRFTFISGEPVETELKRYGHYTGYVKEGGARQRTGFSVPDALKAGKALGVDAVLLGAYAYGENAQFRVYFNEALSIRLIDVNTGKVLWGVTSRQSDSGGTVMQKTLALMKKEAL